MSANLQIFEAINNSTRIWRRNARLWKHTNEGMKRSEKRREIRGSERCPFRGCKIWRSVDHWGSCSAWGNRWREDTLPRSLHWRGRWGTGALWEKECAPRMLLSSISVSHACIDTSRALRSRGKLLLTGPCKLSQPFRKTYTHTFVTGIYCTRYMIWKINISWTWHPSCTKFGLNTIHNFSSAAIGHSADVNTSHAKWDPAIMKMHYFFKRQGGGGGVVE